MTVYPKDTEAKRIWRDEVGLSEDHIIDVEDNFWDIGAGQVVRIRKSFMIAAKNF